ncbi:cytochrome c3 family protein [Geothrix fuzhouensis]|uniref:cytochrome c3 family protein n=1 Tax=Geothrix fuzhouensis TaxID=2966451 RepID=UPI002148364E|nr:cytochrome c3 family protein [Geothrix fuzhouensis]
MRQDLLFKRIQSLAVGLAMGLVMNSTRAQTRPATPVLAKVPTKSGIPMTHGTCVICHKNHHASSSAILKLSRAAADRLCLSCHEGMNGAPSADFAPKLPAWSGQGSGHMAGRFSSRRAETYARTIPAGQSRVIRLIQDCSGCHDPHGKERGKLRMTAFDTRGQLLDRRPQSVAEVCFGCHAGSEAAPLTSGNPDMGQLFGKGVSSAHRIGATAAGRPELPSLRTSAFQGRLDCTSCHDNPDPAGARGPHVSTNAALLKASFGHEKDMGRLGDRVNELCFLCHDKQSILGNQSFAFHSQHMAGFTGGSPSAAGSTQPVSEAAAALGIRSPRDFRPGRSGAFQPGYGEPTTCATCHNSHGSLRQSSLIEFDRSVVSPSSVGGPSFQRSGLGHGTCTLSCHGYDHVQTRY